MNTLFIAIAVLTIALGVILGMLWVMWSSINDLKKSLNEKSFDYEVTKTEQDFYKKEYKTLKEMTDTWSDFSDPTFEPRKTNGKYNPKEIKGMFDDIFVDQGSQGSQDG